jgi:GT2 family glycosyltransferase
MNKAIIPFMNATNTGSPAPQRGPALRIAALIPTFNRVKSLQSCLQCLKEQDLTGIPATIAAASQPKSQSIPASPASASPSNTQSISGQSVSLLPIVIVDGSTDGTLEMLEKEFPEALIVRGDGNWWYTKCINEGIKTAIREKCDFVLTLNDDLSFPAGYVNTLLQDYYNSGPGSVIGSVSLSKSLPRIITFSGVPKISFTLKESNYIPKFSPVAEETLSGLKTSIVLSGRGILYPIEIFERLGLYDNRLVQYSSETDFTYRASGSGIPVMISYNAVVYENVQMTSDGAVYNNPSLKTLYKSFKNDYSINSFRKTWYYSIKHRGAIAGSLIALLRTMGVLKNYVQHKLNNKG